MIYQVERIDRQGNELEWRQVEADGFDMHDDGSLAFYRRIEDGNKPVKEPTVCLFAPGTWGQVTLEEAMVLTDEQIEKAGEEISRALARTLQVGVTTGNDQYQMTTNAITHPFATAEEIERAVKDGRIAYTGEDLPATWRFIE